MFGLQLLYVFHPFSFFRSALLLQLPSYVTCWVSCCQPHGPPVLIMLHFLNQQGSFAVLFEAEEMCLEYIKIESDECYLFFILAFSMRKDFFMNIKRRFILQERKRLYYKPQKVRGGGQAHKVNMHYYSISLLWVGELKGADSTEYNRYEVKRRNMLWIHKSGYGL